MTMERWLDGIDVDLTLLETRDDPDELWTQRALAGTSCLIAERHWDQVAWAIAEHAWRFSPVSDEVR